MAAFILPWTVRNYLHFDAFVPITYGGGNPMLLGTYQYGNPPDDGEIGTDAAVDAIMAEKFARYYDENGNVKNPVHQQYLELMRDSEAAKYRIRAWISRDPADFFKTYLYTKERGLINWVWFGGSVFDLPYSTVHIPRVINTLLCVAAVILAFIQKRYRFTVCFLLADYAVNLVLISTSYAIDRYATLFMPLRFLVGGIALVLMADGIRTIIGKIKT